MANYSVPPDISEKEKIVGGILTAAQLICILIGVGGAALFSIIFFKLIGTAAIILGVIVFVPIGVAFALIKIKGLALYNYLKKKKYHKMVTKKMPNHRVEADNFELKYTSIKKIIK